MNPDIERFFRAEAPKMTDWLMSRLEPCVSATTTAISESNIEGVRSKFCGNPDLPVGFSWPITEDGPCWFLGQLNLKEISSFRVPAGVPKDGMLSFFYHEAGGAAGAQSRIYYFGHETILQRTPCPRDLRWDPNLEETVLLPRVFKFRQGSCLPPLEASDLPERQDPDLDSDLAFLIESFNLQFAYEKHQFFGHPSGLWQPAPAGWHLIASFGELADRVFFFLPSLKQWPTGTGLLPAVIYEC